MRWRRTGRRRSCGARTNIRATNVLRTLCVLGALDRPAVPAAVGHVVITGLDRGQFERDRTRETELSALGYVELRFTYRALIRRPAKEAERIRRNLERWAPHLLGGQNLTADGERRRAAGDGQRRATGSAQRAARSAQRARARAR